MRFNFSIKSLMLLSAVIAVAIGFTRVYLGYHWTTDVLASWCIAAVLLVAVRLAYAVIGGGQSGAGQVGWWRVRT